MTGLTVNIAGKSFGNTPVLGTLAFDLVAGERVCILGPSGCGKSTLLSVIAKLDTAFDGSITRPGGPLAMVFQAPRLLPWRTLLENIVLTPGAGDADDAMELLKQVGLATAAHQFPEKVSLGMQRRAALARALAIKPALVLMDEPLVSLDAKTASEMQTLIVDILDESAATTVIATHDRREALAFADRVIELGDTPTRVLLDRPSPLTREDRRDAQAIETLHNTWFPVAETAAIAHS